MSSHNDEKNKKLFNKFKMFPAVIGVIEIKLNDKNDYLTVFVDYDHQIVVYIEKGRDSETMESFFNFAGKEYMSNVKVFICSANESFIETIKKEYHHIKIAHGYLHILKVFGENTVFKVIGNNQRKLAKAGNEILAINLKDINRILKNYDYNRKYLNVDEQIIYDDNESEFCDKFYASILKENKFVEDIDKVFNLIQEAYECADERRSAQILDEIVEVCNKTENKYFITFGKLLNQHRDGIITYVSNIKPFDDYLERLSNAIQIMRRNSRGYRDDEYFYMKIIWLSVEKCR